MKGKFALILFSVLLLPSFLMQSRVYARYQVDKGILDLRETGFDKTKIYSLNGHWEFYWKQLIEPGSFLSTSPPKPDLYGKIPSYWNEYTLNGQTLPEKGYGTYRALILLPAGFHDEIIFDIPVFDSSFKLFINGKSSGGNGIVGTSEEASRANYSPYLIRLSPQTDTLEVLVQVSNFQHRRGGFWKQMKIGLADQLFKEHQRFVFTSYISMGSLMAFSLFFFFFFLFYRKDKMPLFFSIFLAGIFVRLICTGIYPVTLLFDISWDWLVRFEYMGMYIAVSAGIWFMHFLYPLKGMKPVNIVNTSILLMFCLFIPFTKVDVFAYTMLYFQYAVIIYLLFYLVCSLVAIFTKGLYNAVYFAGFIILFLALLNDIGLATSRGAVSWNYTIHIAVQVFIFIHAVMLIRTWIQAYIEKEKLNREIEYLNTNLEKRILERTAELQERSGEIAIQNDKIAIQNDRLKEEIEFKNRLFSIIAHDLKSPISNLVQYFEILNNESSQNTREIVLKSIHNLAISANDLIDNLLYWGRSQGKQIFVNNKDSDIVDIVGKVLVLFKEQAKQKSIDLQFHKTGKAIAFCDPDLIQIVLRNLVSNAVKFTRENGIISIKVAPHPEDDALIAIIVSDNGVGIPVEKLELLNSGKNPGSTFGTAREKGTGLGMRICFELVKLVDGKMDVLSNVNSGTSVTIILHAAKKDSYS